MVGEIPVGVPRLDDDQLDEIAVGNAQLDRWVARTRRRALDDRGIGRVVTHQSAVGLVEAVDLPVVVRFAVPEVAQQHGRLGSLDVVRRTSSSTSRPRVLRCSSRRSCSLRSSRSSVFGCGRTVTPIAAWAALAAARGRAAASSSIPSAAGRKPGCVGRLVIMCSSCVSGHGLPVSSTATGMVTVSPPRAGFASAHVWTGGDQCVQTVIASLWISRYGASVGRIDGTIHPCAGAHGGRNAHDPAPWPGRVVGEVRVGCAARSPRRRRRRPAHPPGRRRRCARRSW